MGGDTVFKLGPSSSNGYFTHITYLWVFWNFIYKMGRLKFHSYQIFKLYFECCVDVNWSKKIYNYCGIQYFADWVECAGKLNSIDNIKVSTEF